MATQIYFLDNDGFLQGQTAVEVIPENRKHTTIKPPTNFELPKFEAGRWIETRTVVEKQKALKDSLFNLFIQKLSDNNVDAVELFAGILNNNLDQEMKTKAIEVATELKTEALIKINQIEEL